MSRTIGITLLTLAMAAPGTVAAAQETKERPAPPPRAVERQSSGGATSGAERAVPRSTPSTGAESPRAAAPAPSGRATGESGQSRRGSSGSQGSSRARSAPADSRGGDVAVARGATGRDARSSTGVQATDRDRGGRQSFGTAVPRQRPPHHGGGGWWGNPIWYYPYYPLSYGFFWDPWWGYGSAWGAGWGAGSAWGYGGGYGAYQGPVQQVYGGLRLKVKPKEAEVFVDGYFAGIVDDFDGAFQQLNLDVGPHRIEVRHPGHEVLAFEIRTQPDEKITYKGKLKPTP